MDLIETIRERHSVRSFKDIKINRDIESRLRQCIDECNKDSGLNIQLFIDEPKAFDSKLAGYGKFKNVKNYIAFVGENNKELDELCGYYGEKIVLLAQQLGLNTCWVAATYNKKNVPCKIEKGQKLLCVAALGYGESSGIAHTTRPVERLCKFKEQPPQWFKDGMEMAMLAPTAMNQQKFCITLDGDTVYAKAGFGFYTKLDLGIVKYHFEAGAGKENFKWGN